MTAEEIWRDLMAGNERFRSGQPQPRDLEREREAAAQARQPKAMILACCDSRVAPEIIFDQRLGDLFVVRVAGNVADKLAIGSLEFAADLLGVCLLIVIGHQHCKAVEAACSIDKASSPNIKAIIKAVRNSGASAGIDGGGQDALRNVEKQDARAVAQAVLDRSDLLRDRVRRGDFAIVTAYYHLDTGTVERL
ncbi:MAG: carbonic anhydrase [Acidobacteriia bacterium]|nr:carbonic anhydrase [Terriglobia bacterium]